MPRFKDRGGDGLAKVAQVYESVSFDRQTLYAYLHKRFEADQSARAPGGVARCSRGPRTVTNRCS